MQQKKLMFRKKTRKAYRVIRMVPSRFRDRNIIKYEILKLIRGELSSNRKKERIGVFFGTLTVISVM